MNPQRILIVEDDGIIGRDLQETLVRRGYSVPHVSATGERAVELVDRIDPDLVLMDITLNGSMDGIEAAKRIQETHNIPIVYLTGDSDAAVLERARATSPYGFVIKPYVEGELIETVRNSLKRHDTMQRLEVDERRFISTLRSMAEGVITADLAGNITFLNPNAEKITGWSSQEASGRPLREVFRIRDPDGSEAEALPPSPGQRSRRAILLTTKSGESVLIEDNTAPIKDEQGGLTGLVIVFRERGDAAKTTAPGGGGGTAVQGRVGDHLIKMVESIVDPMFTMDAAWRITYVNAQAAGYFGTTREEIIGRIFWDDFPGKVRERYLPEFERTLTTSEPRTFQFYHESKRNWFEVNAYPFADGILTLFKDITQRKNTQEERAKIEKLEGLGFLARGFAHDFNNLLTVLLGNLSLAASRIPEDAEYYDEIVAAKNASVQAQNLVQQLLTFAKGGAPIKKRLNVGHVVEEVMRECQARRLGKGINYFCNTEPDLWEMHADESQLWRMLQNLLRNAEQALSRGGDVMVHCKNLNTESALPDEALHLKHDTDYVLLKIIDNGEGIREEIRHKIFEPYFSGRGHVNASGLGLTVCESIAKAHGGFIIIDSREDQGTTVSVYLPAIAEAKGAAGTKAAAPAAGAKGSGSCASDEDPMSGLSHIQFTLAEPAWPGGLGLGEAGAALGEVGGEETSGRRRILILEDELLIRELIARNLKEAGYEVHQTAEGASTVLAYREAMEKGRRFDLVLTDLSIPEGMGGAEAMAQIRRIDPHVVAIVSSGYSDDPVMANHEEYGFSGVLPKPYEPMELRRLVAEVLEKRESEAGKA